MHPLKLSLSLFVLSLAVLWVTPVHAQSQKIQSPPAVALPQASTNSQLPSDAELVESWARVQIRANPGPNQYLAYEVTARGTAGVVSHLRGFMGRKDVIANTELLSREKLRLLFGRLRDLGGLQLVSQMPVVVEKKPLKKMDDNARRAASHGPERSDLPVFELSFRLGGRENTVLVQDPFALPDRRYAQFILAVRDLSIQVAGDIGYHAPTGRDGEQGYLFIDSVPSAKVWIDDVQLNEETPVFCYTLAPGVHVVRLRSDKHELQRDYKVKISPGQSSALEVDLR